MDTKTEPAEAERRALLMQALGNQYGRLQAARGGTIAESSSRTSVYGGVFIALTVAYVVQPAPLAAIAAGAAAALVVAAAFMRHQWATWMQVGRALPISTGSG